MATNQNEGKVISKQKELKIYGWLMIVLAALDVARMVISAVFSDSSLLEEPGAKFVLIAMVVVTGIAVLAKLWMGRQALTYAKGVGKGTSHILLAKIGLVIYIVLSLAGAYQLFTGDGWDSLVSALASLIVVHSYLRAAKACL